MTTASSIDNPSEEWLNPRNAAHYAGVTVSMILAWVERGLLETRGLGRFLEVSKASLDMLKLRQQAGMIEPSNNPPVNLPPLVNPALLESSTVNAGKLLEESPTLITKVNELQAQRMRDANEIAKLRTAVAALNREIAQLEQNKKKELAQLEQAKNKEIEQLRIRLKNEVNLSMFPPPGIPYRDVMDNKLARVTQEKDREIARLRERNSRLEAEILRLKRSVARKADGSVTSGHYLYTPTESKIATEVEVVSRLAAQTLKATDRLASLADRVRELDEEVQKLQDEKDLLEEERNQVDPVLLRKNDIIINLSSKLKSVEQDVGFLEQQNKFLKRINIYTEVALVIFLIVILVLAYLIIRL